MEDGCVHRGWCRSGTECQRDVDAVSEVAEASRRMAARSICSSSDRYGVGKVHDLTLSRLAVPQERAQR